MFSEQNLNVVDSENNPILPIVTRQIGFLEEKPNEEEPVEEEPVEEEDFEQVSMFNRWMDEDTILQILMSKE